MSPQTVPSLLILTASLIGLELAFFAGLLWRRDLFRWSSAGFWAWCAFLLYFVLAPLAMAGNNTAIYQTQLRLSVAGGMERGLWVLTCAFAGIAVFFVIYLRTTFKPITWGLPAGPLRLNPPAVLILFLFFCFGIYSLLVFRAGLVSGAGERLVVGGRFVGNVTGYQNVGYMFLFVPTILLLFSRDKVLWFLGVFLAFLFVVLSLPHAWSRFATVSFLLVLSLIAVIKEKETRRWPALVWVAGLILFTVVFQLRGHTEWKYGDIFDETARLITEMPQEGRRILSSNDTAMIMTWYVESYFYDSWVGFDYGLPPLNYLLTGWVPSRVFPEKYFMIDWLNARRELIYPPIIDSLLFGAKSTLLGGFYTHGGLVGVLIGAGLAGFLSRRLDGMLARETSNLVKSVAIAWLGTLWMIWGNPTFGGIMILGALAMPGLATWAVLSKRTPPSTTPSSVKNINKIIAAEP